MSVMKISLYAISMLMLICQVGVAQGESQKAKSKKSDLKAVDLEEAESQQVVDDEILTDSPEGGAGDAQTASGEAGAEGAAQKCVPVEKKEGEEGEGDEAGEAGEEGEVECVPVYVPVEPPPVLSDEITFTNPTNPGAEEARRLKAEYDAVVAALGESQELAYKNYQFDVRDRSIPFAQYRYDNFAKSRRGGILLIAIGTPVFGGLTALGAVFLAQAIGDECLPANDTDNECEVPSRRDAEDKKGKGIFLLAFGTAATVASVVTGAIIIKRNNGPMKALEPLLATGKSEKKAFHFVGFSPVVATNRTVAPGASLAVSF